MFSDDLRHRVEKVEKEVDSLKSMQIEMTRITLSIANLSEKMDIRFNGLEQKIDGLDKRISRIETAVIGFLTIILGSAFSIIVWPYLKTKYF